MGHHADTDAGSSWRNGHPTVFLSGCVSHYSQALRIVLTYSSLLPQVLIALCDIAFAVFVLVYSYETPACTFDSFLNLAETD